MIFDLVADLLVALERHHDGKTAAPEHLQERIHLAGVFIGDVFMNSRTRT